MLLSCVSAKPYSTLFISSWGILSVMPGYRFGELLVPCHGLQFGLHRLLVLFGLRQGNLVRLGVPELRKERVRLQIRHQGLV